MNRLINDTTFTYGWKNRRPPVVVLKGNYSYRQLSSWRDQIGSKLLGALDVVSSGINFATNTIDLGVSSGESGSQNAARPYLDSMAIPAGAVRFVRRDVIQGSTSRARESRGAPLATDDSLTSVASTSLGGVMIDGFGNATAGLYVDRSGGRRLITVSHATDTMFYSNGYDFLDPAGTKIGDESADPAGFTCNYGGNTYTNLCRYSDAILIDVSGGFSTRRGAIARTLGSSSTWVAGGYHSSLLRSGDGFYGTNQGGGSLTQGQTLYKVGRRSGTTYGTVSYTCSDRAQNNFPRPNVVIKCSIEATTPSYPGDSGSPLFLLDPDDYGDCQCAFFKGILWGTDTLAHYTVGSYFDSFVTDLGSGGFTITPQITVSAASSFSGQICGNCGQSGVPRLTWTASTTTGTPLQTIYKVYRTTNGFNYTYIGSSPGTLYDDYDSFASGYNGAFMPPPGTILGYVIRPVNAGIYGSDSGVIFFTSP
jgi:hypothetical protein